MDGHHTTTEAYEFVRHGNGAKPEANRVDELGRHWHMERPSVFSDKVVCYYYPRYHLTGDITTVYVDRFPDADNWQLYWTHEA